MGWILTLGLFLSRAQALDNPPIRVRLETSLEKVQFESLGAQIYGRQKNFEFVAIPQRQNIEISRESIQGNSFWKVVRNGHIEIFPQPILALKAIDLRFKSKALPNSIFLAPQKNNRFDIIGVLPLENYLVGVLASEMPLSWPLETLKAQAIAARSYALTTMRERSHQMFHVESTNLDQVFSHIGNSNDQSPLVSKAKEAVKLTEGMVLIGEKNQVLKAYYHSDCGGKTSSAKSVWGYGSNRGGAVDAGCPSNPKAQWDLQVSDETLTEKLKNFLKRPSLGLIQAMQLIRPTQQDRVEKVQLLSESGDRVVMSAADFRAALGFDQLRSTFFQVQKAEGEFQFSGSGFGHGVGLCQWGARYLGKQGKSYEDILSHYYPQAQIRAFGFKTEQKLEAQIR